MLINETESANSQSEDTGFRNFENPAADAVLVISYNPAGTRCAIASADHKLRVYDCVDQDNGVQPTLLEQWKAHNAEILDVQWIPGPFVRYIATIAADNRLKIWREDHSQAPRSGRRFRCISSQIPASHVPWTSLSFHSTPEQDLYLAIFTIDGLLSIYEPAEPKSLVHWRVVDQLLPFGKFKRGTEPRFCVSFHPYPTTTPTSLKLAISAAHLLKIYLAIPIPPTTLSLQTIQIREALAFSLTHPPHTGTTHSPLINHLAWRPGLLSSADTLAFACTDGTIRIVELTDPPSPPPSTKTKTPKPLSAGPTSDQTTDTKKKGIPQPPPSPSSSSSSDDETNESPNSLDLASITSPPTNQPTHHRRASASSATSTTRSYPSRYSALGTSLFHPPEHRSAAPAHLRPIVKETETLAHDAGGRDCWRVGWMWDGSALVSSGEDEELVIWKWGIKELGEKGAEEGWLEWSRSREGEGQ